MSDIKVNGVNKIVQPDEVKMAENTYRTEQFEADVWKGTVDDVSAEVLRCDIKIEDINKVVENLSSQKDDVSNNLGDMKQNYKEMIKTYEDLTHSPKIALTREEMEFLKNFETNKVKAEIQIEETSLALENIENSLETKEKESDSLHNKKTLLETHRDTRVVPQYKKEAEESEKAYKHWQELKEKMEEQQEMLKKGL